MSTGATLAEGVLAGDQLAAARLMRLVDDRRPGYQQQLAALWPHGGKAQVIGITGNPGSGKSSLVDLLTARFRAQGRRVGVLAVDPSSPFSGGAILGDRIRMQHHSADPGVFIRSLATRGALGGLTASTADTVVVMEALGLDPIIVETVGVGQDEVDIARVAHCTVVVTVPGLGDEIQNLKAGILEIADLFVVNKADREGADKVASELVQMQRLGVEQQDVPVLLTSTRTGAGLDQLVAAIAQHRDQLLAGQGWHRRELLRAGRHLRTLAVEAFLKRNHLASEEQGPAELLESIVARRLDPWSAAQTILERQGALP
jgi:LAO/AO transport system kinase